MTKATKFRSLEEVRRQAKLAHKRWALSHPIEYKIAELKKYEQKKSNGGSRARDTVRRLIRKGLLSKLTRGLIKCTDCPKMAVEYDHRDYNKPTEVEPVCKSCNDRRGPAIPRRVI